MLFSLTTQYYHGIGDKHFDSLIKVHVCGLKLSVSSCDMHGDHKIISPYIFFYIFQINAPGSASTVFFLPREARRVPADNSM